MPTGQASATQQPEAEPASLDADAMATAVELTAAARVAEIAASAPVASTPSPEFTPTLTFTPTFTAIPTQCNPLITANVVVNVRSGPDTAYDVVGSLPQGGTATIVGRNDAYTWWYIDYPAGSGNHAWVAGSVVTSACVPAVVQVVAAPPLPTAEATEKPLAQVQPNTNLQVLKPDLVAAGMQYYVVSGKKVHVMVKVTNVGDGAAGPFIVNWAANQDLGGCHWSMTKLAAGKSKDLECDYTYTWGATSYWSVLTVDSEGTVTESNEGNNSKDFKVDL
jgi:hypothetical protein